MGTVWSVVVLLLRAYISAQGCLRDLKVHKSMAPDEIHLQALKELVNVVAKPLSILSDRLWQSGEVPTDWKRGKTTPIFKRGKKGRPRELQASQSHLCTWQDHGADPSGNYAKAPC